MAYIVECVRYLTARNFYPYKWSLDCFRIRLLSHSGEIGAQHVGKKEVNTESVRVNEIHRRRGVAILDRVDAVRGTRVQA